MQQLNKKDFCITNKHCRPKKLKSSRSLRKYKKNTNYKKDKKNNLIDFESNIENSISHSDYLKSKLSNYHIGKHFHKMRIVNPKGIFKRHWCFFIIVAIILSTFGVYSTTENYISKLKSDTDILIETLSDTTKKVDKLKEKNIELQKKRYSLTTASAGLETQIASNEAKLNEYIEQINELNKKIEEKTSWTIPTITLYVPINDSYFKTYMDYRKITSKTSAQWKLLHSDKVKYDVDGLIRSVDGDYIGVALGSKYGKVGDKFILTLQDGFGALREVKLLKVEEKADKDTTDGYYASHRDLVEFVIDVDKAKGSYPTAIKMGDFNYSDTFNGKITGIKQVIE